MFKVYSLFFAIFLATLFDTFAQNEAINCEVARKKYLELNPDVAKVGMDAWSHYSNFGKREGRIWPPCSNLSSEIANLKNQNDSLFKHIASIGNLSKKEISQYNISKIHNHFDFNEKPLSVLTENTNLIGLKLNGFKEKEILDNFLRGVDSLPIIIKDIENSLSNYPKISLDGYYKTSKEFSDYISNNNRIIISESYKTLSKHKDLGRVNYRDKEFSFLVIPPRTYSKRLEKKLKRSITKNKVILINNENLESNLRRVYKVTREYQELYENLIKYQNLKNYASTFFKVLNAPDKSYKDFNYIGQLNNGVPSGFGYLLNDNKQLICSAYWDEGFPVILYSVNIYHNSKSLDQFHRYIAPISSNGKYNRRLIDFIVTEYTDNDIRTFNIYIGDCNEKNVKSGFGCYFFEDSNKSSLQYYKGNWGNGGNRHGEGTHFSNGKTYSGAWVNGEILNGTITWPDKSTYTGGINKYQMNGMGKKTFSNGSAEEGLFENGSFIKSLVQIQQEEKQKQEEEERKAVALALEQTLQELKSIADKEKRMNNAIFISDLNEVLDNPNYYFGKVIQIVVYGGGLDKQDRSTVLPKGYVQNQWFKNTPYYQKDLKPTEGDYINWKRVREVNTDINITINIPNKFFQDDLIPAARGSSDFFSIWLDVYPMQENRSSSLNGRYNSGGSDKDVNFELLHIQRYK
jgi:hypothetical protein